MTEHTNLANLLNKFIHTLNLKWKRRAFKNKSAELLLYVMFLSGLLMWDGVSSLIWIDWEMTNLILLTHMIMGSSIFMVVVGLFWSSHRRLMIKSTKKTLRLTGTVIEYLLITCVITGLYLTFIGNTGNALSWWIDQLHFYSSWGLTPLVFAHALRFSVLNIKQYIKHTIKAIA
jgi:hypothetical protein